MLSFYTLNMSAEKAVFAQILAYLIEIFTRMNDLSLSL